MFDKQQSICAWQGPSRSCRVCPATGPVRAVPRLPPAVHAAAQPPPAVAPLLHLPPVLHPLSGLPTILVSPLPLPPPLPSLLSVPSVHQTQSSRDVHLHPLHHHSPLAHRARVSHSTVRPGRSCRPHCTLPAVPVSAVLSHVVVAVHAELWLPPLPGGDDTPLPPCLPQPAVLSPLQLHLLLHPHHRARPSPADQTAQSRTGTPHALSQTRWAHTLPRPAPLSRTTPPPHVVPSLLSFVPLPILMTHSSHAPVLPYSSRSPRVHVPAAQSPGPLCAEHLPPLSRSFSRLQVQKKQKLFFQNSHKSARMFKHAGNCTFYPPFHCSQVQGNHPHHPNQPLVICRCFFSLAFPLCFFFFSPFSPFFSLFFTCFVCELDDFSFVRIRRTEEQEKENDRDELCRELTGRV